MECPKCHSVISDNATVCPKCHKVFLLECPNCHSLEDSSVCTKCGYHMLVKCSKCGRINSAVNDLCTKCGFPVKTSLAYSECESDEFAAVVIKFNNLKSIRRLLKSKDLYNKFQYKLKNLLLAQVKNAEGLFITYNDNYILNFNKELSFPTSANKAVRFTLKLVNSLTQLNSNILQELRTPLGIDIAIVKKNAEDLQENYVCNNNVKMLTIKKDIKKYLKGTQVVLDQYVWDAVNRDYKTDSLYSMEENGTTTMFYELLLDSYILPPDNNEKEKPISSVQYIINKKENEETDESEDLYAFNVFDINAKCTFAVSNAVSIKEKLSSIDFEHDGKIISLRADTNYKADIADIAEVCLKKNYKIVPVSVTEKMLYQPWGLFTNIFRQYYGLSYTADKKALHDNSDCPQVFKPIFDLCNEKLLKASTPEDARFAYMELWCRFFSTLKNTVIIIDGFENIDDTSLQTLELYFDNFKRVVPNFVFITNENISVHSKIKKLLLTPLYTELKLTKSTFSSCLSTIKSDAEDFIDSFYFEKIKENFKGSYLYFKCAIKYLMETGVLIDFENKLLVKVSKSVVIPNTLEELYKSKIKNFGKNQDLSLVIAFLAMINPELDINTIKKLGIDKIDEYKNILKDAELVILNGNYLILNNYNAYNAIISTIIKKNVQSILSKTILTKIGNDIDMTTTAEIMEKLGIEKEKYNLLCLNSEFALNTGDYDAYLKNCLEFLSMLVTIGSDIPPEDVEKRKMEVYNGILTYLYGYAPTKIYFIENILLMDAINQGDNERIVKLSNLMLQGALISSNYTDAIGLLHNILSRLKNPTLLVDGAINTKFLLLSLVNIEILYNIGDYRECIETANEILSVLRVDILDKIKPASFSTNLFVLHIMETLRLAAFAKLYVMDKDLEEFLETIHEKLDTDLPEKDSLLAIKDFLAGKIYETGMIENYSPFSKVVFLLLQEISGLTNDYKRFAQNIYQAKLLSDEIHQQEIKYFCDLMIAYAYSKIGMTVKAESIFNDIINISDKAAMFNILVIAHYIFAKSLFESDTNSSLEHISTALNLIKQHHNQAIILYTLVEKLRINIFSHNGINTDDIESAKENISAYAEELKRIIA